MAALRTESLSTRLYLWSVTSALAGFLFGFDTVVISGAEQRIQQLWQLSPGLHGIAIGSALYGTVLGALIGGIPADRFGRKPTLIAIGILYLFSAIGTALAPNVVVFMIARVLGGVGIGMSTVAAPLYLSEIAPASHRGRLAGMFQFNIVFGIVIAYVSNALLGGVGANAWRWMLGVAAFPAFIYTLLCVVIPESPRWLLLRQADVAAGRAVLRRIHPGYSATELDALCEQIRSASQPPGSRERFWSRRLRVPIMIAILIALFNQLSGINAILYFAPRIFVLTGLSEQAALLQSVGIGITNLLFTIAGLWLIDRLGRRSLLFIGSFGYILSLGMVAWGFFSAHLSIIPACIFAFIAAHAIGQGAVIWVLISEIFPNRQRAEGQTLGSSTHWICAALLTTLFPKLVTLFSPGYVFLFFCAMMILQLIWVKTMVIETKGVPLEAIQRRLGIT
jgi:sugar porter (SP) family MFS transporter